MTELIGLVIAGALIRMVWLQARHEKQDVASHLQNDEMIEAVRSVIGRQHQMEESSAKYRAGHDEWQAQHTKWHEELEMQVRRHNDFGGHAHQPELSELKS